MSKSVLVDFYNLHLKLKTQRIPKPLREALTEEKMLEILTLPNKYERQEIRKFFSTHLPNVVRKLTAERKQQIRELFREEFIRLLDYERNLITKEVEEKMDEAKKNNDLWRRKVFFDAFTTLEGYEIIHGVSWFDSVKFKFFAEEYQYIRWLIDIYLDCDDWLKHAGSAWLESRIFMYNRNNPNRISPESKFGIPLPEIFPSIYEEAMSVLKGDLPIRRCVAYKTARTPACRNIFIAEKKRGPEQQFCQEGSCRKRIFEHEKKHPEDRAKRYAILDAKQGK